MMRIGKRGLFLILIAVFVSLFATHKIRRAYWRATLKKEIEPHQATPYSSFCSLKKYYQLKSNLVPLPKQIKTLFLPKKVEEGCHRISNIYAIEKIKKPFTLESFDHQDWRAQAIEKELEFFKRDKKLNVNVIDTFIKNIAHDPSWKDFYLLGHFQIKDGVLKVKDFTRQQYRFREICFALMRLLENVDLPDMEFLVSMHDSLEHADLNLSASSVSSIDVPIFVCSKKTNTKSLLIFPDHEMLAGYEELEALLEEDGTSVAWNEKVDKAFWRGATTSGDYSLDSWQTFPRTRLIDESIQDKGINIDAKFSFMTDVAKNNLAFYNFCEKHHVTTSLVSVPDHLMYKYLVDIDGNASTYSRYYWILRSNCLPVKVAGDFMQWYYPGLSAWKHYLPVKSDLSDLKSQILWAENHDAEAKAMADNSAVFAKRYLSDDAVYSYLYHLLISYRALFEKD
ncbi:hypothetical protein COB21_01175 [Candidatus Aerophobetes bacterium]|uniref:Glycosyl transferase CAP10 domain-containing protein n=1 Tax=Aerophobetes bacterium TaxID=2030807 RepID=A0A2A4X6S3_UNCAE|nr:MAG: hypothetical protein COB21_01175 [Candidatus Aerophobetes bacterium]